MSKDQADSMAELSPYEFYPFATFIEGRSGGDWKRHKTLGHAKSAVAQNPWGSYREQRKAVYEWRAGPTKEDGYWSGVDA